VLISSLLENTVNQERNTVNLAPIGIHKGAFSANYEITFLPSFTSPFQELIFSGNHLFGKSIFLEIAFSRNHLFRNLQVSYLQIIFSGNHLFKKSPFQ